MPSMLLPSGVLSRVVPNAEMGRRGQGQGRNALQRVRGGCGLRIAGFRPARGGISLGRGHAEAYSAYRRHVPEWDVFVLTRDVNVHAVGMLPDEQAQAAVVLKVTE